MVFLLHLEGGRHGDKGVDRENVDAVDVDKGLLGITNKQKLVDCTCN